MKIIIKQGDWTTKKLPIKNKTMRTLKNGRLVPTALCMYRQASKI